LITDCHGLNNATDEVLNHFGSFSIKFGLVYIEKQIHPCHLLIRGHP